MPSWPESPWFWAWKIHVRVVAKWHKRRTEREDCTLLISHARALPRNPGCLGFFDLETARDSKQHFISHLPPTCLSPSEEQSLQSFAAVFSKQFYSSSSPEHHLLPLAQTLQPSAPALSSPRRSSVFHSRLLSFLMQTYRRHCHGFLALGWIFLISSIWTDVLYSSTFGIWVNIIK